LDFLFMPCTTEISRGASVADDAFEVNAFGGWVEHTSLILGGFGRDDPQQNNNNVEKSDSIH
jgi:hypothetical protein